MGLSTQQTGGQGKKTVIQKHIKKNLQVTEVERFLDETASSPASIKLAFMVGDWRSQRNPPDIKAEDECPKSDRVSDT